MVIKGVVAGIILKLVIILNGKFKATIYYYDNLIEDLPIL